MENKFLKVTCKCGHVGRNHFIRISFPLVTINAKNAASIARYLQRVKHDHKYAILECIEINKEEYNKIVETNNNDPYLNCSNHQEQDCIDNLFDRIEDEPSIFHNKKRKKYKKERNISFKIKKQKEVNKCLDDELNKFIHGRFEYELLIY